MILRFLETEGSYGSEEKFGKDFIGVSISKKINGGDETRNDGTVTIENGECVSGWGRGGVV